MCLCVWFGLHWEFISATRAGKRKKMDKVSNTHAMLIAIQRDIPAAASDDDDSRILRENAYERDAFYFYFSEK